MQTRMETGVDGGNQAETDKGLAMNFRKAVQAIADEAMGFTIEGVQDHCIAQLKMDQDLIVQRLTRVAQEVVKAEVEKSKRALEQLNKDTCSAEQKLHKLRTDAHYALRTAKRHILKNLLDTFGEDGLDELVDQHERYKLEDKLGLEE